MQTKLATVLLLGFVLIAAAACSGGDDGLSTAEEEALQKRVEEAERQAAQERERRETAEREREAAEQEAADAAAAEQEAADAEAARQAAEQAREAAEQARQAAEQQQEQLQQQLTEAEQAELRARASAFGLELDLGDGTNPGTGTPTGATAGVMTTATVTWRRGESLTFRPSGTLTPGSAAPSVPGGWRSASFTGQTGTAASLIDDTVYLYTNIQAPGTRAFWKKYGLDETMSDTVVSLASGSSARAKTETPAGTTTTNVTEITVSGRFDGAGGTFTCTTACADTDLGGGDLATSTEINTHVASHVTFSQGRPIFVTPGNWTFKPGSITSGVPLDQDDAYLYFGAWSSIPDDITGTYNFRYIAGGGAESGSDLGRFSALTGSATFRGGAVGRYVTQGQVGGQNAKIGTFTATATLNANFGAADAAGSLSGRITDFREDGSSLEGWRVTLGSATNVGDASDITLTAAGTDDVTGSTVANIGGLSVGGSWGATFHGSDNDGVAELTDTAKYPATRYPPVDLAGVTGWFDAIGPGSTGVGPNDVALSGAFGAVCATGTMCAK